MTMPTIAAPGSLASAAIPAAVPGRARFADALRNAAQPARSPDRSASPLRTLETVERAQRRLDEILAQARAGRTFTGPELLALQAEAHRFSHTVEIASKIVEQGAQTIKQAVNSPL